MTDTNRLARDIRRQSLKMVHRARASHIGSALSISDILAVLYGGVMRFDASQPMMGERDRFILSKGHACVAVYAALAEVGFLNEDDLVTFGKNESWLMNHISHKVNGVEFSTGALGHGLPFAVGKALYAKRLGLAWRTYVILGDGEMDEGANWEALMFASHHKLSNLYAIIDYNKLQSLTSVSKTLALEPLADKLVAFGCLVSEVDGHDHVELDKVLASRGGSRPRAIIAHTVKGKGVSFMENKVEWHYRNPNSEQLAVALKELED
ncbi:MAG: transketolase [Halioglobus sp.]